MIKTTITNEIHHWPRRGRDRTDFPSGSGMWNVTVKRWKLFGVTIWKSVLWSSEVKRG